MEKEILQKIIFFLAKFFKGIRKKEKSWSPFQHSKSGKGKGKSALFITVQVLLKRIKCAKLNTSPSILF